MKSYQTVLEYRALLVLGAVVPQAQAWRQTGTIEFDLNRWQLISPRSLAASLEIRVACYTAGLHTIDVIESKTVYTNHVSSNLPMVRYVMRNLKISADVLKKLADKHQVDRQEVEQCFANRTGRLLTDSRAKHKSNPPTLWFLAPTNTGRILKIVYIQSALRIDLKSTFEPNDVELAIYAKHGK